MPLLIGFHGRLCCLPLGIYDLRVSRANLAHTQPGHHCGQQ
ncbi:hypothetical protein SXCC_02468 [Gluconacetobacter sp. SXCC-1]|nr:hypothetical protein SXCC_02468 [Gluconacetobacter sp. SXCC-1]